MEATINKKYNQCFPVFYLDIGWEDPKLAWVTTGRLTWKGSVICIVLKLRHFLIMTIKAGATGKPREGCIQMCLNDFKVLCFMCSFLF